MILSTTYRLEETGFYLCITDNVPSLHVEGRKKPLFEGDESAAEFIRTYLDIVEAAELAHGIEEDERQYFVEMMIRSDVEKMFHREYDYKITLDDSEYGELEAYVFGTLIDWVASFDTKLKAA